MRKGFLFVAVPSVLGIVAYAVTAMVSTGGPSNHGEPSIELPDVVDLGTRDPGPTQAIFTVRNRGNKNLELSNIRTGCGCMAIEVRGAQQSGSITSLTVPPESSQDLILRVSLRPGEQSQFRTNIDFATNDPDRPQVSLPCVAVVAGTITASPTHWLVGNVNPSDRLRTRVEIRDTGRIAPCTIDRVTTNNPAIVSASLTDNSSSANGPPLHPRGRLLAIAELELFPPKEPGDISVTVSFFESGRESPVVTVPVTGRLLARVNMIPAEVVLPRQTGKGPIDEMTVIIQSSAGVPFSLEVEEKNELTAHLTIRKEAANTFAVTIRWPETIRPAVGRISRRLVRLTASFADEKTQLTIPVVYRTPD